MGFNKNRVILMPIGDMKGIVPGADVIAAGTALMVPVGEELLGRVISGVGVPLDGKGEIYTKNRYPVTSEPINPLERTVIDRPLSVGVRAIDGLNTVGRGQRIGIFSGSGVGKSTLIAMISRYTDADVNVVALIGERGREVKDFVEKELGPEGLRKSVVVVATSNQPAMMRIRGAYLAHAIAEYFRDQGKHVNLLMDSITRFSAWPSGKWASPRASRRRCADIRRRPFPSWPSSWSAPAPSPPGGASPASTRSWWRPTT